MDGILALHRFRAQSFELSSDETANGLPSFGVFAHDLACVSRIDRIRIYALALSTLENKVSADSRFTGRPGDSVDESAAFLCLAQGGS